MRAAREHTNKRETKGDKWEHVSNHFSCCRRICNLKGFFKKNIILFVAEVFCLKFMFHVFERSFDLYDRGVLFNML